MVRLEAAGIDSRAFDSLSARLSRPWFGPPYGLVEQLLNMLVSQEARCGLLERGEVRDFLKPDDLAQVRGVGKDGRDAAIVSLEERLEDQARESRYSSGRLRELLGTAQMGIQRQSVLADSQGH